MKAAAQDALTRLKDRIERCDRIDAALQELAHLARGGASLYDPIADRVSVQLPGDLLRRIAALADHH